MLWFADPIWLSWGAETTESLRTGVAAGRSSTAPCSSVPARSCSSLRRCIPSSPRRPSLAFIPPIPERKALYPCVLRERRGFWALTSAFGQVGTYDQFKNSYKAMGITGEYSNVFAASMTSGLYARPYPCVAVLRSGAQ